jgi:hypothetical protein
LLQIEIKPIEGKGNGLVCKSAVTVREYTSQACCSISLPQSSAALIAIPETVMLSSFNAAASPMLADYIAADEVLFVADHSAE